MRGLEGRVTMDMNVELRDGREGWRKERGKDRRQGRERKNEQVEGEKRETREGQRSEGNVK